MKKSKFTEIEINEILREAEAGLSAKEACLKYGISLACFYQWKTKYGGVSLSELTRIKELEAENARLKRLHTTLALENHALRDAIEKKL